MYEAAMKNVCLTFPSAEGKKHQHSRCHMPEDDVDVDNNWTRGLDY